MFTLSDLFVKIDLDSYDPTIENTHHKIVRFRKVNFNTDIVDTAGMVSLALLFYDAPYLFWTK